MASERPPFRADIEGLRGAAILLVVLFHAGVSQLAGGFVGVDVFFVLSGYFITGLLAHELHRSGGIDITAFYASRALRLLPALLVVLMATLAAVTWLYAPIDRAPVAATARAVALWAGNIDFARGAVDYFSRDDNPLLHTWSLGVEQQFYAVWPLLLLAAALVHERRIAESPDAGTRRPLLWWTLGAGAASLAACVVLTRVAQPWAFFGMPARIWEFALGGAIALGWTRELTPRRARLLQAAGLGALVVAVASYDRLTPYPGIAALLPALGTVALIVGGDGAGPGGINRVLSVAPLRWLGRVSYAWYLWHWPLVGLGAVLLPGIGTGGRLAWSALALVLAWLTLRVVEEPARRGSLSRLRSAQLLTLSLVASLAAALVAHASMRAAQRAVAQPVQHAFLAARNDRMEPGCWVNTVEEFRDACIVGERASSTTIALLGDSHAQHWLAALDRAGRERGWKVDAMVKGGCPVSDMPEQRTARLRRTYGECIRYREAMLQRIVAMRPSAVILSNWDGYLPRDGGRSPWQVTPDGWRRGLRRTYARLAAAGITTIVLRDTPTIPFDAPACLSRRAAQLPLSTSCAYARRDALSPAGRAAQDVAARGLPVQFVDMNDQVCATSTCGVLRDGLIVFTDDDHLTATFSRSLAPVLGARIASSLGARAVPSRSMKAVTASAAGVVTPARVIRVVDDVRRVFR